VTDFLKVQPVVLGLCIALAFGFSHRSWAASDIPAVTASCEVDIGLVSEIRKGMTYEQVKKILRCEPTGSGDDKFGNGVPYTEYYWETKKGDGISVTFINGLSSGFGAVIRD
jgi:hypothetical protein